MKASRREFLRTLAIASGGAMLAACEPKVVKEIVKETVVVEKPVEKVVEKEKVVKETVVVQGEAKVVEKLVTTTPEAKKPVTIRWGSWAVGSKVFESLGAQFKAKFPNVTVQQEAAPWNEYWDRLQVQTASGTAPDVMWMSGAMFLNYVEKGFMLDITPRAELDNLKLEDYFLQADVFNWNGRTYAWPWFHTVSSAWYNPKLFEEAGVEPPPTDWTKQWTWDEFLAAAQKLTKKRADGRQQYGALVMNAFEQCWGSFMWSNGGDVMNKEKTKTTMNEPKAVEGLQFVVDLVQKYKVAPEPGDPSVFISGVPSPFVSGLCAIEINSCAMTQTYSEVKDFTPSACCLPIAPGGVPSCSFNGNPNALAAGSKYPDEAWAFMSFLSSEEGMLEMAKQHLTMPANIKVCKEAYVKPPPLNLDVFVRGMDLKACNDLRFHKRWLEWVNAIQAPVDLALIGESTVQEACDKATKDGNEVLTRA
jgi:multiple sugar transport system substrate-binding protein